MRLFLIGWAEDRQELVDVVRDLESRGHSILYWSRSAVIFPIDERLFPGIVFHDYEDAVAGRPARALAGGSFDPPGEKLLEQLYDAESIFLTMANKKYDWMTVAERKHLYYRMVGYWSAILKTYQPEAIVFAMIPHTLYNYVIYKLAKLFKIPMIMPDIIAHVKDRLLLMNDFEAGSAALIQQLEKNKDRNFSIKDLSQDLQEYVSVQTGQVSGDTSPAYIKKEVKSYTFFHQLPAKVNMAVKSVRDKTFITKTAQYLYKKFHDNLEDEYKSVQASPDFTKKFVYAALQYQPECTTSPVGGIFVDQILTLEILSAALPKGWVIYVKEHPVQWLSRGKNFVGSRYRGYYKAIAKIKNIVIVPTTTNNFSLIHQAQAVATITGTTGWEAVLRSKPAIVFGFPWYQHCSGVRRVYDVDSCRVAFQHILQTPAVDQSEVIRFLYAFDRASFNGYVEAYGNEMSSLSPEQNKTNITTALVAELDAVRG